MAQNSTFEFKFIEMTNQILRDKSNMLAYGIILSKFIYWIVIETIGETKSFFVFL